MIAGKTNGVYPAPKAIMSCVYEGLQLPFDTALKVETRYFVSLLRDPVAKSMIRTLFFGLQEANKLARRPKGVAKQEYTKIGVLGAGLMGAGIATVSVQAGLDIVLIDRDQAAADKGKAHIADELGKLVKRGRLTQDNADALLAKVTATPDFGALKDCQLVVEAVFENREVKAEATKKAEAALAPDGGVRVEHLDPADHRPGRGLVAAGPFHRPAFLLAGREDAAGRDHRRQEDLARDARARRWTSCRRSARRRSWSTTAAASSRRASAAPSSARAIAS